VALVWLWNFFQHLCSKAINYEELDLLENELLEILYDLQRIFLLTFFDIMVHWTIHLVNEIRLEASVQYQSMFVVERYPCEFKSQVLKRYRPDACMAECYLPEEYLTFYSRYLHDGVKTRLDRWSTHYMRRIKHYFFHRLATHLRGKNT